MKYVCHGLETFLEIADKKVNYNFIKLPQYYWTTGPTRLSLYTLWVHGCIVTSSYIILINKYEVDGCNLLLNMEQRTTKNQLNCDVVSSQCQIEFIDQHAIMEENRHFLLILKIYLKAFISSLCTFYAHSTWFSVLKA